MAAVSKFLLYFLSLGVAGYAVFAYGVLPLGSLVHPDMKASFLAHPAGIYTHAFASVVALALGPFQFSAGLRRKRITVHRWLGRAYLSVGVLVGGVSGLYMAQYALGGTVARLGFALLASLWLYTGVRAYLAVRRGEMGAHRKWMVRNYALTFAAVMLRLYVPAAIAAGFDFTAAYTAIAWLCWVPNVIFCGMVLQPRCNGPGRAVMGGVVLAWAAPCDGGRGRWGKSGSVRVQAPAPG